MRVEQMSPSHPHSLRLLNQLSDILATITGNNGRSSFDPLGVQGSGASFVVAYDFEGNPVGCGGYRPLAEGVAELKRMFAVPGSKGVGKAILSFLERKATDDGYREMWLETRLVNTKAGVVTLSFSDRKGQWLVDIHAKQAAIFHASKASRRW